MQKINLPIYEEGKCFLFALGRNAIYAACKVLQINEGDEILTPAFDCEAALQPFKALGCNFKFYRSDPFTFSADIEDIRKKITTKTRLIHIVNHFGFPQPWNDILAFRKEVNIPILEDNAYSLFSKYDGSQFGTFGDMAIFSLRKNLPLIDGGMLRINNPKYNFRYVFRDNEKKYKLKWDELLKIEKSKIKNSFIAESLKSLFKIVGLNRHPPLPLYSDKPGSPCWCLPERIERIFSCDYLRSISLFAKKQLRSFSQYDYEDIIRKKRYYYELLSKKLSNIKGINILWPDLPEGIVPHCFTLLAESHRDTLFKALWKKYDVLVWPTLPKLVLEQLDRYPEVELLGRRMLQINLPFEKVRLRRFPRYLENIVKDISLLSEKYIK